MGIPGKILIVDDEPEALENCSRILRRFRYDCLTEPDPVRAVDVIKRERPGLVLTDLCMPGLDGIGVLNEAKRLDPEVHVVLLTAHATVQTAVTSMRQGALDYILKPFTGAELEAVARRAFAGDAGRPSVANESPQAPARRAKNNAPPMLGDSRAIRDVLDLVSKVARTDANVLIYGESGTGKELAARTIHSRSLRAAQPFVPVDCVSLPDTLLESELFGHEKGAFTGAHTSKPGLFEMAQGGTVFLDEVSGMSQNLQARLLRVLQERQVRRVGGTRLVDVDVRVIAASNQDLEQACRQGTFREDLYFRLNVIPVALPPLRAREGDIRLLAREFLGRFSRRSGLAPDLTPDLSPEVMELLVRYPWPGNVRELQNVIERAVALAEGSVICVEHVPERLHQSQAGDPRQPDAASFKQAKQQAVQSFERNFLVDLLTRHGGHMGRAAREAGVDRKTIERMVKRHGLRHKR